jgi:hypothetical protein
MEPLEKQSPDVSVMKKRLVKKGKGKRKKKYICYKSTKEPKIEVELDTVKQKEMKFEFGYSVVANNHTPKKQVKYKEKLSPFQLIPNDKDRLMDIESRLMITRSNNASPELPMQGAQEAIRLYNLTLTHDISTIKAIDQSCNVSIRSSPDRSRETT